MKKKLAFTAAVFIALCITALGIYAAVGDFTLLHQFAGGADDGFNLLSQKVLVSGGKIYGMSFQGGDTNWGVIYSMNTDGTGFTLLHEFTGGADGGGSPYGSLIAIGATLYGMTNGGGDSGAGVIFSINQDGSGFTLLHEFTGGAADWGSPYGSLTLSGGKLYGMTIFGGDAGSGTIFSINTDGTGFTRLHEFAGGADDGSNPLGSLTASGGKLYGMTNSGGDSTRGVIFSINEDGSGFTLLHEFSGGGNDGFSPRGSLLLSGGKFYGMAFNGGDWDRGVIFSMNQDGSGFALLHEFEGGANDGASPLGDLALYDGKLYGMSLIGGDADRGVLFSINPDGSGFGLLREFAGADGHMPYLEGPVVSGNFLYGATYIGGAANGGVVFRYELPAVAPQPPVVPHCFINTLF
ncbi:MAG: hypothetical protein HZB23_00095 [Deltaproteobacteria bacterium]|nr:hypothetical protein [Deltaproteobacteria bacterium]